MARGLLFRFRGIRAVGYKSFRLRLKNARVGNFSLRRPASRGNSMRVMARRIGRARYELDPS